MKNLIKKEIPILVLTLIPIIIMVILWDTLPDQMPIHFNFKGEVDGYGSKNIFLFLTPLLYVVLLLGSIIDPWRKNLEEFSRNFYKIRLVVTALFSAIPLAIFMNSLNPDFNVIKLVLLILSVLFVLLGNYIINIKKNWILGIRTPWTLSDDEVWRKTHRVGGKLFVMAGLFSTIGLFVCDIETAKMIFLILMSIVVITPIIYSYVIYKRIDS